MILNSSFKKFMTGVAIGSGVATITTSGRVLDVWFPSPRLEGSGEDVSSFREDKILKNVVEEEDVLRNVFTKIIKVESVLEKPPVDTADAYLRLHLLSHRLVKPNTVNLDGIFEKLGNIVWTSSGACEVEDFEFTRSVLRARGNLTVYGVDKFPRMVDYVVPSGVRIGDADRVRLGAYLSPGTTVMHEGFVNFNAGTLGVSMVEGRISAGVVVGDGTDIGGGASIMGTLSGGGKERISLGERVLLGANAGVGISLGDDCTVESGLYVTAGSKVSFQVEGSEFKIMKAVDLSHVSGLLFRRNSVSGGVEVIKKSSKVEILNSSLHKN